MKNLLLAATLLGTPTVAATMLAEKPNRFGVTDLPYAMQDVQYPKNYAVYSGARTIIVRTSLLPARILERNGQLVRQQTAMNRTLPVHFYQPATPDEVKLWKQHFG